MTEKRVKYGITIGAISGTGTPNYGFSVTAYKEAKRASDNAQAPTGRVIITSGPGGNVAGGHTDTGGLVEASQSYRPNGGVP